MVKAEIGDVMKVNVYGHNPRTIIITLTTQKQADYANRLLNDPMSGWELKKVARAAEEPCPNCERLNQLLATTLDGEQGIHVSTGGKPRDAKLFSALDVQAFTAVGFALRKKHQADRATPALRAYDEAMQTFGVPHEPLQVYDSNSWRRIGVQSKYSEIVRPTIASDGHLDIEGTDTLHALVAAFNAMLELRGNVPSATGPLKLDTERQVFFYEQDHYYLSSFSAFRLRVFVDDGSGGGNQLIDFDTREIAYHWHKFPGQPEIQARIRFARSSHEAFKLAEKFRHLRRPDWDEIKFDVMRDLIRGQVQQHEYIRRKLLETGDRELIENSWRDDVWGWGLNRDGQNMLGKLWMEIRAELRASSQSATVDEQPGTNGGW